MTRTIAVPLPENFTGEAYWMNRYKPWEEPEITCVTVTGYTAKRVVIDDHGTKRYVKPSSLFLKVQS